MKKAVFTFLFLTTFSYLYCANFKDMTNIQEEIWKDIPGFEGYYQASYSGKIRSVDRVVISNDKIHKERQTFHKGRELKPSKNRLGYLMVYPSKGGPKHRERKYSKTVHSLVGLTWIPNPDGLKELNHLDTNKENNSVPNLKWCTRSENMQHAHDSGLIKVKSRGDSPCARRVYQLSPDGFLIGEYESLKDAEMATGIGFRQISSVCLGKNKTVHGLKFTY
jgi:hypothetical protein